MMVAYVLTAIAVHCTIRRFGAAALQEKRNISPYFVSHHISSCKISLGNMNFLDDQVIWDSKTISKQINTQTKAIQFSVRSVDYE